MDPKPSSGNMLDGELIYPLSPITLLGRADIGEATPSFHSLLLGCLLGIFGRAKGFAGPVAPALRTAPALALLGDGAGSTIPEVWVGSSAPGFAGVAMVDLDVSLGEASSALLASSDASPGICTRSCGRFASD